jgi:hypothetical protein
MTAGEINRELDRIDARDSVLCSKMIEQGRGNEPWSDFQDKNDPLSVERVALSARRQALRSEARTRYDADAPHPLPKFFRPRRR